MRERLEIPERWLHDPLYRALEAGNLRAARAMLEKRTSLSWHETAMYAPLAFHHPRWLLKRILDLGPKDQVFCAHEFVRPGGGWTIRVCATLLVVAAAADDLPAVEELLARGYSLDWYQIHREYYPNAVRKWTDSMTEWYSEAGGRVYHLDLMWMEPKDYVHQGPGVYPYEAKDCCSPLSAAIWCGAVRCVERLLPERPEDLSLEARQALSWGPLPGDEARRQAVTEVVCRKYGLELEELLNPGEFLNRSSPLFLPCLERHPEWFNQKIATQFVEWSVDGDWERSAEWAWNALPLIPEHLMAAVVLEKLKSGKNRRESPLQGVFRHPLVHLAVDRCAVPADTGQQQVLEIIEHMSITGAPPEGGLSGLAMALLNAMLNSLRGKSDLDAQCRARLLKHPKVLFLLETEEPEMVCAYLNWKVEQGDVSSKDVHLLMALLELREEFSYEL